jgi:hypothetical protein
MISAADVITRPVARLRRGQCGGECRELALVLEQLCDGSDLNAHCG